MQLHIDERRADVISDFIQRLTWQDIRANATSDEEACRVREALDAIGKALVLNQRQSRRGATPT
jgi:hypothetical protein